jgi:hypothetical protein
MTLKKRNGKWSLVKIGVLSGIFGSVAACFIAAPIAIGYCKTAISPWTTLPDKVSAMSQDIADIKKAVTDQELAHYYRTNETYQVSKYGNHIQ